MDAAMGRANASQFFDVASVVKYSAQKLSIPLNRGYSYINLSPKFLLKEIQ
jgi:hypothetical protein